MSVATVLTACGIETLLSFINATPWHVALQQYLPLAVLKQSLQAHFEPPFSSCNSTYRLRYWNCREELGYAVIDRVVATVLTACGIETSQLSTCLKVFMPNSCNSTYRLRYWNRPTSLSAQYAVRYVATVLTACGIETKLHQMLLDVVLVPLQQYLPLAVLKLWGSVNSTIIQFCCNSTYRLRYWNLEVASWDYWFVFQLQQYLPLAVLKPGKDLLL